MDELKSESIAVGINKSAMILFVVMAIAFVFMLEHYSRMKDQVRILTHPAQLQVLDPDRVVVRGRAPGIRAIECKILPCGQYRPGRECVVACTMKRSWAFK
jgi:hypothetical protein